MNANLPFVEIASDDDVAAAYAIHKSAVVNHWSLATFSDCALSPYTLWVCKINNNVIGYAVVLLVADEATLMDIAVSATSRGTGCGRLLLQTVVEYCERKRVSSIWLEVRASNVVAQNLYHSFSFDTVERRKNYYSAGVNKEDAMIMQRICQ